MIKVAVLDDYQNVFQQIVETETYTDRFDFKVFNEPFAIRFTNCHIIFIF